MSSIAIPHRDETPALTAHQWRILAICFIVALVDGFDTLMLAFIAPLIGKAFHLAPVAIGQLFGAGYLGAVIGGLSIGPISDRFGRKTMLLASLAMVTVFTFWCSLAESPQQLMLLRFLAGLGLGGAMPTVIALTAEHMPVTHRARAVTWMFMGYPLGAVVGGAVTAATLSHGWQAIFAGGAVAALVMLPLVMWGLPESLTPSPAATGTAKPSDARRTNGIFGSLTAQFGEGRAPAALLLWFGVFSIMIVSYFLVSWMPTVLVRSGYAPERAAIAGVVLNVGSITGALLVTMGVKRFGPWRPVIAAFFLGAGMLWALGLRIGQPQGLWFLVFLTGLCIFGGQLSCAALSVHLFPRHVRGAGTGWTMGVGRIGSIVGPVIGGVLMGSGLDLATLFRLISIPVVVAVVSLSLAAWLRPGNVD